MFVKTHVGNSENKNPIRNFKIKHLVPTCPKNRKNRGVYDIPSSGIFTTSVNTSSQASQTIGDFYDVIGRIGSISNLKVLIPDIPDVGNFYDEYEHEIFLSGTVADDRGFFR